VSESVTAELPTTRPIAASFPPGHGGLTREQVAELRSVMNEDRMTQGGIGYVKGNNFDSRIRSGQVQWIMRNEIDPRIHSHLFTLASVANRERNWNFEIDGLAHALQATRYSGEASEHYDWHMDWGGGKLGFRKISAVAHLSEESDFAGGSLQLTNGSFPIQAAQAAGTVTVFPSFLMHRVTPVTAGCRLAVVAWVLGPSFR